MIILGSPAVILLVRSLDPGLCASGFHQVCLFLLVGNLLPVNRTNCDSWGSYPIVYRQTKPRYIRKTTYFFGRFTFQFCKYCRNYKKLDITLSRVIPHYICAAKEKETKSAGHCETVPSSKQSPPLTLLRTTGAFPVAPVLNSLKDGNLLVDRQIASSHEDAPRDDRMSSFSVGSKQSPARVEDVFINFLLGY